MINNLLDAKNSVSSRLFEILVECGLLPFFDETFLLKPFNNQSAMELILRTSPNSFKEKITSDAVALIMQDNDFYLAEVLLMLGVEVGFFVDHVYSGNTICQRYLAERESVPTCFDGSAEAYYQYCLDVEAERHYFISLIDGITSSAKTH